MTRRRTFARRPRKRPDGPRDVAAAVLFLTGARTLDGVTAEWLARAKNLSLKRAEAMLAAARQRRAGR